MLNRYLRIAILLFCCFIGSYSHAKDKSLPALGIDINQTSASGLSSGAFMTSQFYIANSEIMVGAGIIAGGPYLCAQSGKSDNLLINATSTCMNPKTDDAVPDTARVVKKTKALAKSGTIDALANLKNDKIYLFSSQADKTVTTKVVDQTEQFFLALDVPKDAIYYDVSADAGHGMITNNPEHSDCEAYKAPFINNCDFAQAHRIMNHIYDDLAPPSKALSGNIYTFDQSEFIDTRLTSMSDDAYIYVPKSCKTSTCRVHVVFHGCQQSANVAGDTYHTQTGYNEIADSNNMVVLYPQVQPSMLKPFNPRGCWDFWGYSASDSGDYYSKQAPQLRAVRAMIDRLAQKPPQAH